MIDLKTQFNSEGFCVIDDFLTPSEVEALKNEGMDLVKNMPEEENRVVFSTINANTKQNKDTYFLESADKIRYFYEESALDEKGQLLVAPEVSLNKIGHALHELNPIFKKFTFDERVKEICYQLGYQEPAVVQSMYIFKNPGVGGEVTPHQDAWYLYTTPVKVMGLWIALDDATLENGCLKFVRGSHKSGVHRRYIRNPDKTSSELLIYDKPAPIYQKNSFHPVPVKKGSCVLIDGQVVHSSDPNKSQHSRHAYTFHVIEQKDTKYSEDNWLQLGSEKAFLNMYKN